MFRASDRTILILTALSAVLILAAAVLGLVIAPPAAGLTQDETYAQRIIYFHVPSAWLSMLAFGITMIASIAYLRTAQPKWDSLSVASAELGLAFTVAVMAS